MSTINVSCGSSDVNAYNPELIYALKSAKNRDELALIYEKYDSDTVVDAMFAIDSTFLEESCGSKREEALEEWLWESYYTDVLPVIEDRFIHRHEKKAC